MPPFRWQTVQTVVALLLMATSLSRGAAQAAEITEAQVRAQVIAHTQAQLKTFVSPADAPYIDVQAGKVPGAPFRFPEAATPEAVKISTASPFGALYSDRGIVRVKLESAAGPSREIGVPVQIVIKKPVWVVKTPVSANQPLSRADFALESRDVSHTYAYAAGAEKPLGLYVARVNLMPGEVLDARKIILPPDVRCNDEVRIFITSASGMTVTIPGVALANGRIGEQIRVRQAVFQRKYYSAKVIDKNQVLVEM